jgi:hypothetical protein
MDGSTEEHKEISIDIPLNEFGATDIEDIHTKMESNIENMIKLKEDEKAKSDLKSIGTHSVSSVTMKNIRSKIVTDIVAPSYYTDVKDTITSRKRWLALSNYTEVVSKILSGTSTVVAFASGVYQYQYLSFIAGCLGTIGIVSQQFSSYAKNETAERTDQANKILSILKIETIPDLSDTDDKKQ